MHWPGRDILFAFGFMPALEIDHAIRKHQRVSRLAAMYM